MIWLKQQLFVNWPTLYFIYGLSFFLLGFAIIIQRRRTSRLHLASALPMLAMFAIIHGVAEWGYLFIPIHKSYLDNETIQGLRVIQVLLWALSFLFLISFGTSLLRQMQNSKLMLWPVGIAVVFFIFGMWLVDHSVALWLRRPEVKIFVRYFLCVPGALLASIGLWRQEKELKELGFDRLIRYLKIASLAFAAYAAAGGLVVPKADFFPANIINRDTFQAILGFPVEMLRATLSVVIAFAISKLLRMFDLEDYNRLVDINRREALTKDRERISKDLHDGVIQSIYAVGLILQRLKKTGSGDSKWFSQMDYVLQSLDGIVTDIRRYIQDLRLGQDDKELETTINLLENAFAVPIKIEAHEKVASRLSPEVREQINFIVREALTNVCKHAKATKAFLSYRAHDDVLEIEIQDNGQGIQDRCQDNAGPGQKLGLSNIKSRVAALNGTLDICQKSSGLSLHIRIPWEVHDFVG